MSHERINCPICQKRLFNGLLDGHTALIIKCIHCGRIIEIIHDDEKRKIKKRVLSTNTL